MKSLTKATRLCAAAALAACVSAAVAPAPTAARPRPAAQKVEPAATRCDLHAYVVDADPAGLNVRSGPGKQFAVVGNLPPHEYSVQVRVTGAAGQWLRIEGGEKQDTGEVVFRGAGWVFGPMLATQTKDYAARDPEEPRVKIFKQPSARAAVVTRLPNETEVNLIGCKGRWAQVRHKNFEGWLDPASQCYSTLTTCS
jgi:SH3-like domain-containing protein